MIYDFIGDIHGHTRCLEKLLLELGYRHHDGCYRHPEPGRRAVFLGDYIDRGPEIRQTLHIVRSMAERESALAIMGNHEYNAICFHTPKPSEPHRWMRSRTDKNIHQHIETLYQFKNYRREWENHLSWFANLPLWLDLGGVRAVHAAWIPESIGLISSYSDGGHILTSELLQKGTIRGNEEFAALQNILKGPEIPLPDGAVFVDPDGNERSEMRVRWWLEASGKTFGDLALRNSSEIMQKHPDAEVAARYPGYRDRVPVFFGHYWLRGERPSVLEPRIACLDYSVAADGFLAAYTWRGESTLDNDSFTFV